MGADRMPAAPAAAQRPGAGLWLTKLMVVATAALSLTALCAVSLQHMMLPDFDRGNPDSSSEAYALATPWSGGELEAMPPPPPQLSDDEAQEAFLELVKRRASIQTPLDTSFWRPYIRSPGADKSREAPQPGSANSTQLIFVAGAEGTGHHFITALLMRVPSLMPMTLVQEQVFQSLWWKPKERDPSVFWSAVEAFSEWVRRARSLGKHPAFCARSCLRTTGQKHCSWVSGLQLQGKGRLLDGRGHNGSFQPIGQMFSYPFSRSWNETEDGTHYPEISDLQYMCDILGLRLRVLVLWRDPIDAIMSMNNRGLPKIWRRFGRTFKLHKQVALYLSQLDEMHAQIQTLRSEEYRVFNYTNVLINPDLYATPIADFLNLPGGNLQRSFTLSLKAKPKKKHNASLERPMDGGTTGQWSDDVRRAFIATRLAEARNGPEAPRCGDAWRRVATRGRTISTPPASSPPPHHLLTTPRHHLTPPPHLPSPGVATLGRSSSHGPPSSKSGRAARLAASAIGSQSGPHRRRRRSAPRISRSRT